LGKPYLITDSIRKIHWKITSEIKMIAGFSCRRANAIIMDSVYVVAFYTDEIIPRGGPESFTGLPGMILGIALPYDHTTWFATRVSLKQVSNTQFKSPTGEKKINNRELKDILTNDPTIKMNQQKQDLYFHKLLL
jgi:GLPGLI family protein